MLHCDDFDSLPLSRIGEVRIERVSNVEYNNRTHQWEAHMRSGQVLTGATRQEVLQKEIQLAESQLCESL